MNPNSSSAKPKRVRRKCKFQNCTNRVVQGGVCVSHGAKRKLCSFSGCSKAVKVAGFCSAHGPTRKKCDYTFPNSGDPCTRVAVQGGRCLSHGARRRMCAFPGKEGCTKNAVQGGYCKKHHDLVQDASGMLVLQSSPVKKDNNIIGGINNNAICMPVGASGSGRVVCWESTAFVSDRSVASISAATACARKVGAEQQNISPSEQEVCASDLPQPKQKIVGKFPTPQHKRGLSIFDEMQTVDAIISREAVTDAVAAAVEGHHKKLKQGSEKTPKGSVTFADGTRQAQEVPITAKPIAQGNVCLQNPSCTCPWCRSPTLAIFEQMLQASHQLDNVEIENERYAGLSPPKLSPLKRSSPPSNRFLHQNPLSLTSLEKEYKSKNSSVAISENKSRADHSSASIALAAAVKFARGDGGDDDDDTFQVNRTVSRDIESPKSQQQQHGHPYCGYPTTRNYHPSQYYHHNLPLPHYYYQQQPHPQFYYRHQNPKSSLPMKGPGTPVLRDDSPRQQPSNFSRNEKKSKQKRLLPKPRETEMEHLFTPSDTK